MSSASELKIGSCYSDATTGKYYGMFMNIKVHNVRKDGLVNVYVFEFVEHWANSPSDMDIRYVECPWKGLRVSDAKLGKSYKIVDGPFLGKFLKRKDGDWRGGETAASQSYVQIYVFENRHIEMFSKDFLIEWDIPFHTMTTTLAGGGAACASSAKPP